MQGIRLFALCFCAALAAGPARAEELPWPENLCRVDLEGPSGAVFGHVDTYADPDGGIEHQEFYLDYEFSRRTVEGRDEPEDEIWLEATWALTEGRLDESSEIVEMYAAAENLQGIDKPVRFVVRLDGTQVIEGRVASMMGGLYDEDLPNVYGHRSMEILLYDADGRLDRRARVELPDWDRLSATVLSASRGELYQEECGSDGHS